MARAKQCLRTQETMGFLGLPEEVIITRGKGVAEDPLSAFDKAEINARISDINAIVVTSFIPVGASLVRPPNSKRYLANHPVVPGSLVPVAMKYYCTTRTKQRCSGVEAQSIFAAIGIVMPEDTDRFPGIIMEYAGPTGTGRDQPATAEDVRKYCAAMCLRVADFRRSSGFRASGDPEVWVVEQALPERDMWACVLVAGVYANRVAY